MVRHVNQRALTVNPERETKQLQAKPESSRRRPALEDLDLADSEHYESAPRLGNSFYLLVTGQSLGGLH